MKGLAFLAAGSLLFALHLQRGEHAPLTVQDLSGAARRYPLVALTLSLAVLGLGGLPPLAGFMSKWQIFVAGFRVGAPWAGWLVAFAALNSVLSLAYYAPLVKAVLGLAVVAIGVWPNLMTWLTAPAGDALARAFGG
jgi:NADH:ubiquinone oxidoreductase subunit 2 (subunit N)